MIYLGADHGGFTLKEKLKGWLKSWGMEFEDLGNYSIVPNDDYPDFAAKVCGSVKEGDKGILVCRTGQGMAIAANRFPHIRAILGSSIEGVRRGRSDEDANVLALAADLTDSNIAEEITKTFFETQFSNEERHNRRIAKLADAIG